MTSSACHPALPAFAVFAGFLAAAGIPIYIFAPTFYAQNYGTGLTAIAAVLFWLRLLDAVQDPIKMKTAKPIQNLRSRPNRSDIQPNSGSCSASSRRNQNRTAAMAVNPVP